jgi:hypothetical protein
MAQTRDLAAEKARKQKIILAVGGVLLAVVLAIQLPKLLSSGGSETPAATPATDQGGGNLVADAAAVANNLSNASNATAAVVVGKPAGYVAGVALPSSARAKVSTGQLAAFTLFETKDPFVQQVSEEESASSSPSEEGVTTSNGQATGNGGSKPAADNAGTGAAPGVAPSNGDTSGGGTGSSASSGGSAAPEAEYSFATLMVNGNPEQVEVKQTFPTDDDVFVLADVKKKAVKIGVAGGSLEGGKPVTLKLGKKLTLVNTATGVRWVLKLVYTGTQPETLETFTTGGDSTDQATP